MISSRHGLNMQKRILIFFGLIALVGCGDNDGKNGDSNPAPVNLEDRARADDDYVLNQNGNRVPSLLEPSKMVDLCKQGQSMWLDKCYDEIRIVIKGGISCRDELGVKNNSETCPEFRHQKMSFSLISDGKEEQLWALGENVSPLLQAARFALDDKREDYLTWKSPLTLSGFLFSYIPFSSIVTSHPKSSKIEDSKLLSVDEIDFRMNYILSDSPIALGKLGYACPSRGKLIMNDVEINLPVSTEEFHRMIKANPVFSEEVQLGDLTVVPSFEKVDDEQCLRDKETILSAMKI